MTPTPDQVVQWVLEAGAAKFYPEADANPNREDNYIVTHGFIHRLVTRAMAEQAETTLLEVAETLRRAGATLPAPGITGTIEGAVVTGLCVALASVETKLAAIRANAPKVTT